MGATSQRFFRIPLGPRPLSLLRGQAGSGQSRGFFYRQKPLPGLSEEPPEHLLLFLPLFRCLRDQGAINPLHAIPCNRREAEGKNTESPQQLSYRQTHLTHMASGGIQKAGRGKSNSQEQNSPPTPGGSSPLSLSTVPQNSQKAPGPLLKSSFLTSSLFWNIKEQKLEPTHSCMS